MLWEEDVCICDTGVSNHVTLNFKGAMNLQDKKTLSLQHTVEAIETTALINILGQFISESGKAGLRAVLEDCSYNKAHKVHLVSLSRLLHCQGWIISHRNDKMIHIENGKGGDIQLDIVVPTAKGAIYVCRFA